MIAQLAVFALVAFAAALFVVLPLVRRPSGSARRTDYDLQVYKDQLAEVERDLERGLLTSDQAEAARLEVQRRMLALDAEAREAKPPHPAGRGLRIALAVVVVAVMPVGAVLLYGVVGSPGLPDRPYAAREAERLGLAAADLERVRAVARKLEERLQEDPGNRQGWLTLAQTYGRLEQWADAVRAYEHVVRLGNVDAETWSALGEANVFVAQGQVGERAQVAFRNALQMDRDEPRALFYFGLARQQAGEPRHALAIWRHLSATSPEDAPWLPMLRARMAEVAQASGILPMEVEPRHPLDLLADGAEEDAPPATAAAGDAAAAQADAERAPGAGFSADEQAMIEQMVGRLAQRLEDDPDDFEGWMRLGRSYDVLRRPAAAADAYRQAVELQPKNLDARFAYAKALLTQAEADGAPQPPPAFFETVRVILDIQPDNPDALYFAGLGARLDGDPAEARRLWTRLLEQLPPDSPQREDLQKQIDALPASG